MKRKNPAFQTALLAFVAVIGFTNISGASLIAYEGFNYTAGLLPAPNAAGAASSPLNGGTGWAAGGWFQNSGGAASVQTNIFSSGLSYSDLSVVGNAFHVGGNVNVGVSGNANVFRTLASPVTLTGNDIWLSFIGVDHQGGNRVFGLSLYSGTATEDMGIGHTTTGAGPAHANDWGLTTAGSDASYQDGGTPITTQSFLLVEINAGTVSLWVNPNIDAGQGSLGTANASISLAATSFDTIRLFGGNNTTGNGYGEGLFDEIRLGTTFADVTPVAAPEPAGAALFGVGLAVLALISIRRKLNA